MKTRDIVAPETAKRLADYRRALDEALPGRVKRVILFGSHARGDADADSDVDVAVFVGKEDIGETNVLDTVAETAYGQIINGFDLSALTLPDDYLEPVDGCFRSELARRIAHEGIDI